MIRRILMTGDTVGGVWTYCMELAEALGAHGVEVVLATMGGPPPETPRLPNLELLTSDYRLEWMEDPWADVEASGRWLLDLARRYRPDVVHLNSFGHGMLAWDAPVIATAHSCVLSWWQAVKGCAAPSSWDRYRRTVTATLKAADVVTAPSAAMAGAVAEHYGIEDVRVIPNGRRSGRFRRAAKEPFILSAGRLWDEAKNVGAVAAVAPRLDWPVYLAGRPPLGWLAPDELAGWYSRASIYALPARYEPFGLSALEAALSGCALVLGDIPSLREVWGDAAVFVGDEASLEGALGELIADPEYRRSMADRAFEHAAQYTPERMASEYMDAYVCASQFLPTR